MENDSSLYSAGQIDDQCATRRSVSIFSRRGTATPKPRTLSMYEAMTTLSFGQSKRDSPVSPKKNFWSSKSKQLSRNHEGTVLHAVPQYLTGHSVSALDIAMAVSPNEEILQAINKANSINTPYSTSPVNSNSGSGLFDSRIGLWRDGVARWDVGKKPERPMQATTTTTHSHSVADRTRRPQLSVRIPGNKLRQILGDEAPIPYEAFKPVRIPSTSTTAQRSIAPRPTVPDQSAIHPAFRTISPFSDQQRSQVRSWSSSENSRSSVSSNTIFQDDTFDHGSCYSRRSSMTSMEAESPDGLIQNPHWNYLDVPKRSVSAAFSITSPVKAGIFDEPPEDGNTPRDCSAPTHLQIPNQTGLRSSEGKAVEHKDQDSERSSLQPHHRAPSPTLSEAVHDLQMQLSTIVESSPVSIPGSAGVLKTPENELIIENLTRAPTLPKKSRKREWLKPSGLAQAEVMPASVDVPTRRQSVPSKQQQRAAEVQQQNVCRASSVRNSVSHDGPESTWLSWCVASAGRCAARAFSQEAVCIGIMASLSSFDDLKSFSKISKQARRYYEDNKLYLLKAVQFRISAPAWELRELSPFPFGNVMPTDFLEESEVTPAAYMSCLSHDRRILRELKAVIVAKCQSFIRPETISCLMTEDSTRFEDAIYRIWSFCKIFGCDRGREDDVKGQLDWLRGGVLAHQKGCAATLTFNPEFELDGILLNAPEHFAASNGSGLSAEQLYDMSEMWECLRFLLQPYEGETDKAKSCGIFRSINESSMTPMLQGRVLEEWIFYILSLGPSVVLELSRFQDSSDAGFDFAHLNDWTDWTLPPPGMSRKQFFRGPVSQLYEERLLASLATTKTDDVTQTLLRKRQTAEMNFAYRQACLSNRDTTGQECALVRRDSALAPEVHTKSSTKGYRAPQTPRPPLSPENGWKTQPGSWSPRKVSPIIEDRVDTFNRLSMLSFEGMAEDTSGIAINKIMDIGFSNAQAKEALRVTDMGNGLRVDRAVDWLLRQNRF